VHGIGGGADRTFRTGLGAVEDAGVGASTVVVAPHFESLGKGGKVCPHGAPRPTEGDLHWRCAVWAAGATATNADITSLAALDRLVEQVAGRFSHLGRIVVAGHSAGGQVVVHEMAVSKVELGAKVALRFVVANPSAYLYLDDARPRNAARCTEDGCPDGFAPFPAAERTKCPTFDDWKYGLAKLDASAAGLDAEQLRRSYLARDVVYLFGALDDAATRAAHYDELDRTCAAEAQGPFRRDRGLAFMAYLRARFGATPVFHVVPGCGHSAECMFGHELGRAALVR
jgi:hypothetical protein